MPECAKLGNDKFRSLVLAGIAFFNPSCFCIHKKKIKQPLNKMNRNWIMYRIFSGGAGVGPRGIH